MIVEESCDILALIDIQPAFMSDGELPIPDGEAVIPVVNRLLNECFSHAFAVQDWHPPKHISFASSHANKRPFDEVQVAYGMQMLYGDHALQKSPAAELHPQLEMSKIELIIRKGFRTGVDGYSAFFENDHQTSTGLAGLLRDRKIRRIFFVGMAIDYCVAWSAQDAVKLGFEAFIIEDACRGLGLPFPDGTTTLDVAKKKALDVGVEYIKSAEIKPAIFRD